MNGQSEPMRARLRQAGLIQGEAPDVGRLESPWYVKVLLAFSGWLAALLLLGFIGMGFEFVFENSGAAFGIGILMIGGAYAILRLPKNEFVEHLALAVSLAGQALVVFALFDFAERNEKMAWLLVAVLEALLAMVMPNFVHRVFSSFTAVFACDIALTLWNGPYVVSGMVILLAALCWLNEFSSPSLMRGIQALGYGLVLALMEMKGTVLFGSQTIGLFFGQHQTEIWTRPWMGEALAAVVALYVVWQLLQRHDQDLSGRSALAALAGTVLICGVSIKVQGLTTGLVIILLGFAGANRVLLGLGIVSLLFYLSAYYYLLDATLLAKSGSLLTVGLLLLSLRWVMGRIFPEHKEATHA